jgi:NADPH2:quinone reductase
MKAIICREYGPPESLRLEEVETPKPQAGQVSIAVEACGVNFPDSLIIQGKYQIKPDFPFSPGSEVAGRVLEIGAGVTGFKPGDRVLAGTVWGGYAEQVAVDAAKVSVIPDGMDFVTAAGFLITYGTSIHALKQRAHLQPGENLLVLGASGGVGLSAVQIGKAMGARVIAAASSDEKLAFARDNGADELINYADGNLKDKVKALTGGKGADVIYDPVGGDMFDQAMRCINWQGRLLVVGFASGRIPQLPVNLALVKGCDIVGVFWGAFVDRDPVANAENNAQLFSWFEAGKIRPHVDHTYPLAKAVDALNDVLARKVKGKIVLTVR